jgi:hypothetical protein
VFQCCKYTKVTCGRLKYKELIQPWSADPFGKFLNAQCTWVTIPSPHTLEEPVGRPRKYDHNYGQVRSRQFNSLFFPKYGCAHKEKSLQENKERVALHLTDLATRHPDRRERILRAARIIGITVNLDWEKLAIYQERYQYIRFGVKEGEGSPLLQKWLGRLRRLAPSEQQAHTAAFLGDRERFLTSLVKPSATTC